jgi:hypothetical protein
LRAQDETSKQYNGKHFSFRYPGKWDIHEYDEADVIVGGEPQSAVISFEIALILNPPPDRKLIVNGIEKQIFAIAAGSKMEVTGTHIQPGAAEGPPTLYANLHSATDDADLAATYVDIYGRVYVYFIMYVPGRLDQAVQLVTPIVGSIEPSWETYDGSDFSFDYPPGWQLTQTGPRSYRASNPINSAVSLAIEFRPGVQNHASNFVQCATMEEVLNREFERYRAAHERHNPADAFDRTTVTYDRLGPGYLGGMSIDITEVEGGGYHPTHSTFVYWNVVPRENGIYWVELRAPSALLAVIQPILKRFQQSVILKGPQLAKGAYCGY